MAPAGAVIAAVLDVGSNSVLLLTVAVTPDGRARQRDAALATYEKTIQTAFQETADALARQGTIADQLRAQTNFQAAAADTLQLVNARYQGGIDTFLSSLDAQRSFYTAQRTLITTTLTGASNRVTLYRVLGGDSTLEATPQGPQPVTPNGTPRDG